MFGISAALYLNSTESLLIFTADAVGTPSTCGWDREPSVGLGPLTPQGVSTSAAEISRQILTATHRCGTSLFCISAPSTSLEVAFSVRP